ncbi:MAG: tyrosine-type recombinase/integrase [Shewanella sp.]
MKNTAASLLAKLRLAATPSNATKAANNTKSAIAEPDQATVKTYIRKHCAAWLSDFFSLSVCTGWRTQDCASLTSDCIDWETGKVTITISKQTKAAESRSYAKALEVVRESRKAQAVAVGDSNGYMVWSAASRDTVAESLTEDEQNQVGQAVANAPRKVDTKQLPAGLVKRLRALADQNPYDNYIFSSTLTQSNRCISRTGSITRQTIWAHMKQVFAALAGTIANAAKLSAYSLRKTFAINMLAAAKGNISIVMALFGHSTISMTTRYLGLDSDAEALQSAMSERYDMA